MVLIQDNMNSLNYNSEQNFITELKAIVSACRQKAYSIIDTAQVVMNWNIGKRIVEQEQCGQAKAQYGKYVPKSLQQNMEMAFRNQTYVVFENSI